MMNRFAFANQHQNNNNNNAMVCGGEMMNSLVVCPKPRRLHLSSPPSVNESIISTSSSRRQYSCFRHQTEIMCESKARTELLDLILTKECYDVDKVSVTSSPPFFYGSPPSRSSNPVVQDAQFGNDDPNPNPSARNNGGRCRRGQMHPAVRIEGFNSRGISAVA